MEQSLKARLIGAAVLVAIAVLLIPELLSGRKTGEPAVEAAAGPRGARTFTIELGNGQGESHQAPSAALPPAASAPEAKAVVAENPPGAAPVAAGANPVKRESAPDPAVATSAPVEPEPTDLSAAPAPVAVVPAASPPPANAGKTGGWSVQVGAFGSLDTARGLVRDLTGAGYRAYISPLSRGGKTLHRVRVGPEADKAGAEQLAKRLKSRGLPVSLVQNP